MHHLSTNEACRILGALPNVGPITQHRLLEAFGGKPEAILKAPSEQLSKVRGMNAQLAGIISNWPEHVDLQAMQARHKGTNIGWMNFEHPDYPPLLREIYDYPLGLYTQGKLPKNKPTLAIVGTRKTSAYGLKVAEQFARELAAAGVCIVSGLASGIDTAAHKGALNSKAPQSTIGVLGCGINRVYPSENRRLYAAVAQNGAILSELGFDIPPSRASFPMRNRIVAGLSQAVLIIESPAKGGSMITARLAVEYNRLVCAVPGRLDQINSEGPHLLIREGASLVRSVGDIIAELNLAFVPNTASHELNLNAEPSHPSEASIDTSASKPSPNNLSAPQPSKSNASAFNTRAPQPNTHESLIFEALRQGDSLNMDELTMQTKLSPAEVAAALMQLELSGFISKRPEGTFERC